MLIREQVTIKLFPANMKHYAQYGYIGNSKDEVLVWTNELTPNSKIRVLRVCDECGEESRVQMRRYTPICKRCATQKSNKERADASLTTCNCGKPKSYSSPTCRSCWDKKDKKGENSHSYGTKNPQLAERNKNRSPKDHWNYKGGISKRSGKQVKWAVEVKEEANNKCDCCDYDRGIALVAHHLYSNDSDRGDFTLENGVCLCHNCHVEFHKTYGFGSNTEEQYIEFKENYND